MALRQVADGAEGLKTWRVAANTLAMQSWESEKGCFCGFGLGRETSDSPL